MGPQRNSSGADDVTTKSISGLESLVDQIPAIAENDSGVFSGSGAGSHPNTPRSVGPYSPAAGGPGSFHTSPFHTPTASNHFNPADGLNAGPGPPIPGGGAGGPPGAGGPTNPQLLLCLKLSVKVAIGQKWVNVNKLLELFSAGKGLDQDK